MLNRRQFLARSLQTSTLLACAPTVPTFLAASARAADSSKDTILVVLEMAGGNDGLNTVAPHGDDLYRKARPTLALRKGDTFPISDRLGINMALSALRPLQDAGHLATVLGVGYPNPDRSHFESMDIWQSADPTRGVQSGWLGRGLSALRISGGQIPALQVGAENLPLALSGTAGSVVSLNPHAPFQLELGAGDRRDARRKLLESLAQPSANDPGDDLLAFVRRRQVETLTTFDKLREVLDGAHAKNPGADGGVLG